MRANAHNFQGKFHLDIRKELSNVREIKLWRKLPREAVECPLLEALTAQLGQALDKLICSSALTEG